MAAVVARGQERVAVRVIDLFVNAVYDARELRRARVKYAFESFGVVWHFDLGGVAGADGVYPVGKDAAGLEIVRAAVELHELRRVVAAVDIEHILHEVKTELALECNVMYRQQVLYLLLLCAAVLCARKHRDHRRVPVVAVDNVHIEAEVRYRVEHRAAEERVLLALRVSPAVYLIAEILFIVNEIYRHAVEHELFYPDVFLPPAELCIEIEHVLDLVGIFILYAAVVRGDDSRVDAELGKRLRERAHNVRQPAGLGERRAFGRDEQNVRQSITPVFTEQITKFLFHSSSSLV